MAFLGGVVLIVALAVLLLSPIEEPKGWSDADALVTDIVSFAKSADGTERQESMSGFT